MNNQQEHDASASLEQRRFDALEHFSGLLGFYIKEGSSSFSSSTYKSYCDDSVNANAKTSLNSSSLRSHSRSASVLIAERKATCDLGGASNAASPSTQIISSVMDKCLYRDDGDSVGGAIISVPAMDLQSPYEDAKAESKEDKSVPPRGSYGLPVLGSSCDQKPIYNQKPAIVAFGTKTQ